LKLIADVRAVRPDVAFGADLIAGFPTETEAMFRNTLDLVETAGLAFLHVFPYSPRPGTPAARMPPVPKAEVRERAARLRAAGEADQARHLASRVGREVQGLVERPGLARAEDFSEIAFSGSAPAGEIRTFRVTGQDGRRLLAEPDPRIAGGQALDPVPIGGNRLSDRDRL
jgi:threonylcarbamoyladenosine tRNA methylthiotransferase MtaB